MLLRPQALASALVIVVTLLFVAALWLTSEPRVWSSEQPEVFLVDWTKVQTLDDAERVAGSVGGVVATPAQIQASQAAGASWCKAGWASDGNNYFPAQAVVAECGTIGVNENYVATGGWGTPLGVLVYGPKQRRTFLGSSVPPFSPTQYSRFFS